MILDLLNVVPLVTEPNRHVTFSERGRPADTPDKELCRLPQAAQGIECDLLGVCSDETEVTEPVLWFHGPKIKWKNIHQYGGLSPVWKGEQR